MDWQCCSHLAGAMAALNNRVWNGTQERKLVFSTTEHPATLQKHLHKQWMQGQNCDLIISASSCDIPVHSCVASCFSTKIQHHLLHACAWDTAQDWYSLVDDGIRFTFHKSGEKRIGLDIHQDVVKVLVSFMYTGSLAIPQHQTLALLAVAQGLGVTVVVDMVEVFINRNPDVVRSQTLGPTSRQPSSPQNTAIGQVRSSCAVAEVCEADFHGGADTLCLDSLELDIKKEMVDTDLNTFLDLSAHMQGRKEVTSVRESGSSLPGLDKERGGAAVDRKVGGGKLVVKVEQEVLDDFPVHFEKVSPSTEKQLQETNVDSEMEPCSAHSSDEGGNHDNDDDGDIIQGNAVGKPEDEAARSALENYPFFCMYCTRSYSSRSCLRQHVLKVHNHQVFAQKTCPHCDQQFDPGDVDKFKAHCSEIHKDFVCEVATCDYRTILLNQLRSHKSRIHGTAYPCSKCSHQATSKSRLLKHRLDSHAPYSCPICNRKFLRKENFTLHSRVAHKRNELQCPQCKKYFSSATKLVQHCQKCHGDGNHCVTDPNDLQPSLNGMDNLKPSLCSLSKSCMETPGESNLDHLLAVVHQELSHEMDKLQEGKDQFKQSTGVLEESQAVSVVPSQSKEPKQSPRKQRRLRNSMCQLCNKQMESPESYYQHLRDKHQDTSFHCQECHKSFLRKEGLTLHLRTEHHGRQWTCSHCAQIFHVSTQFLAHCKTQHSDPKPFHCLMPSCRFRAASLKSVESHQKYVHVTERSEVCDKCGNHFPSQKYLRLHQRACLQLEQHLCPTCGEVFSLRQSLLSHINNKHGGERRYTCGQCGQRFSCHANRNRHMRIHNNDFPYMCEVCGQKFRHSNSLKDHMRRKHGTGG